MAKAENTRRAYRAAVRAWCEWCAKRNLPPLPGSGADVAAFLAPMPIERMWGIGAKTAPRLRALGFSTLGDREVLDVDAAVAEARRLGYARVVSMGWSMGGTCVLRHAALVGQLDR